MLAQVQEILILYKDLIKKKNDVDLQLFYGKKLLCPYVCTYIYSHCVTMFGNIV